MYADNVKITDNKINYRTNKGLAISLNKDEVKSIKKTRVTE